MKVSALSLKNLVTAAATLSLVGVLSGCGNAAADVDKKKKEEEVIAIPVAVAQVNTGEISSNYSTTAVLEAIDEAFVVPRAAGIVSHLYVEEGDYVEKGQLLAQIDPVRYELALARSKANLDGLQKELDKINKVHNKNLISDDTRDKLNAQYDAAKASYELAKLDLQETSIHAPISGYIAERNVKVGNLTESFQRQRMFHIVEQKQLYGIIHLPEKELSSISAEQTASLQISALKGKKVPAVVERISPIIDSKTGTFKVTLRVENPKNILKAGMFAEVKLNYDTHQNATLLPREAMLNIDNEVNVFVISEGKAVKKTIITGYQEGDYVEVLQGLSAGDQVVVTGHYNLKDQAPVEIVSGS